jgi:homoserine kinase
MTTEAAEDYVHVGFVAACAEAGRDVPRAMRYDVSSEIPVARGLGSSAAALVAGVMLAERALRLGFDRTRLALLGSRLEGHPDNASPAVLGGAVLATPLGAPDAHDYAFTALTVHERLAFAFAVPSVKMSTEEARAALPATLPHRTAVAAAAKAAALVQGLARGDDRLLAAALDDVLHVPFRERFIPAFDSVRHAAKGSGAVDVTLSGSGSTLVAIADRSRAAAVAEAMAGAWKEAGIDSETFVAVRPAGGAG